MKEIAEKLRSVNWSRTIPDMNKITNSKITENLNKWYRSASTIGNKSTADAIRYTKTT
jgi:hypothetical protein